MDGLFIISFETRLCCYMAGQKNMKEDSPPWHIACGLARDGLPQEAGSLCRLKKKLDEIIEEKNPLRTPRHHLWPRRSLSCKSLDASLPASLALIVFPQQILVTAQYRIFIEMETWSDTAWVFSCPSHPLSSTELVLLSFKYLLHVVTVVSPPQTHTLGIKTRHCLEHCEVDSC